MTRTMRDSTAPQDIKRAGCDLFAGYVNGSQSQWPQNAWSTFPAGSTVSIDTQGTDPHADVLDVEKGNPTDRNNGTDFSITITWVNAKLALKGSYLPLLYANRSTLTPLFNALNAHGLYVNKHFKLWIATLDGTKSVKDMTGVTAVQYLGQQQTGGHYDESIVYDDAWKRPVVTPPPVVKQYGALVTFDGKTGVYSSRNVTSADGGKTWQ